MPYDLLSGHRLFVDESGDHVMDTEKMQVNDGHRYLSLTGCLFAPEPYRDLCDRLHRLKVNYFAKPVILHREDMVGRRKAFSRLCDDKLRAAFDADLCNLLHGVPFLVIGIVIDKLELSKRYPQPEHPYHIAMEFLLQRYCFVLEHYGVTGDVVLESRGKKENMLLEEEFTRIYTQGCRFHRSEFYQKNLSSRKPKIKEKTLNIAGLQIADILANPLCKQARCAYGRYDPSPFEEKMFGILEEKYNRHIYTGETEGCGWVLFPK